MPQRQSPAAAGSDGGPKLGYRVTDVGPTGLPEELLVGLRTFGLLDESGQPCSPPSAPGLPLPPLLGSQRIALPLAEYVPDNWPKYTATGSLLGATPGWQPTLAARAPREPAAPADGGQAAAIQNELRRDKSAGLGAAPEAASPINSARETAVAVAEGRGGQTGEEWTPLGSGEVEWEPAMGTWERRRGDEEGRYGGGGWGGGDYLEPSASAVRGFRALLEAALRAPGAMDQGDPSWQEGHEVETGSAEGDEQQEPDLPP